jgi:hypothetical protein
MEAGPLTYLSQDDDILQKSMSIDGCLKYFFRKLFLCQQSDVVQNGIHRTVTYFTRHAHLDDIFKMAENMNSDEIIDEVLSASLTQDYTNAYFQYTFEEVLSFFVKINPF